MENNQTPQNETTPNQFRKLCTDVFVNEILETLKPFEEKRKKVQIKQIKSILICVALVFIVCFISYLIKNPTKTQLEGLEAIIQIILCTIFTVGVYVCTLPKIFEQEVKKVIMPIIFNKLPNFKWMKDGSITPVEIKQFKLFGYFNNKENDDSFFCNYKNIKVCIDECQLNRDKRGDILFPPFKGVLVQLRTENKLTNKPVIIKADGLKNGLNKLHNKTDNALGKKILNSLTYKK